MKPAVLAALCATSLFAAGPQPYFSEPSISPDGSEIALVSGGDIWTVPSRGGAARLLISNPATEFAPHYSPDGKYLAFISTRTGNGDVYVLTLASGELTRLTFDDADELVKGWSPDSRWVYFSSTARDISGMNDVYRVSREGGTPMPVGADRYTTEYFAAPAPGGRTLAITARGKAGSQWWRQGAQPPGRVRDLAARGSGAPAVVRARDRTAARRTRGRCGRPTARAVLHVRPQRRAEHLGASSWPGGAARQMTQIHRRPRAVALDLAGRPDDRVRARFRHLEARPGDRGGARGADQRCAARPPAPGVEHMRSPGSSGSSRSRRTGRRWRSWPTAKFSRRIREGRRRAQRASRSTRGARVETAWAPDSRRLVYISTRDGRRSTSSSTISPPAQETQLTDGAAERRAPRFSPDGKWIAFVRDAQEVRVLDMAIEAGEAARDRDSSTAAVRRLARHRLVARRHWSRTSMSPARRSRTPGWRRRRGASAARQLPGQHQRRLDDVEPGRQVPDVRRRPSAPSRARWRAWTCCRARRNSARTSSAICSKRPPPSAAGERSFGARAAAPAEASAPAGQDHVRRHPRPPVVAAGGADVTRRHQPGREDGAAGSDRRAGSRTCTRIRSTSWRRSAGRAAADVDAGPQGQRAVHPGQQGGLLSRRRPHRVT